MSQILFVNLIISLATVPRQITHNIHFVRNGIADNMYTSDVYLSAKLLEKRDIILHLARKSEVGLI